MPRRVVFTLAGGALWLVLRHILMEEVVLVECFASVLIELDVFSRLMHMLVEAVLLWDAQEETRFVVLRHILLEEAVLVVLRHILLEEDLLLLKYVVAEKATCLLFAHSTTVEVVLRLLLSVTVATLATAFLTRLLRHMLPFIDAFVPRYVLFSDVFLVIMPSPFVICRS